MLRDYMVNLQNHFINKYDLDLHREQLDDLSMMMAAYAVACIHDTKLAEEAIILADTLNDPI